MAKTIEKLEKKKTVKYLKKSYMEQIVFCCT